MFARRIWSETVAEGTLAAPSTVALLRRFSVAPIIAVWPATLSSAQGLCARYDDAGLPAALWPMLPDADGRWLNAENAGAFASFVERVCDEAGPREIVLDIEPAIDSVRDSLASSVVDAHRLSISPAGSDFARDCEALAVRLEGRGVTVSAAVTPLALLAGAPAHEPRWSHATVMLYTSMIEGWSRGALRRADARAILDAACRASLACYGGRAGASLGAVGTGAFGNEPTYRNVGELADDVAIARAAGLEQLTLFDLGGVLRREPCEAWLEAFVATPPAPRSPESTLRGAAALAGARLAGGVLGAMARVGRATRFAVRRGV